MIGSEVMVTLALAVGKGFGFTKLWSKHREGLLQPSYSVQLENNTFPDCPIPIFGTKSNIQHFVGCSAVNIRA